MRGSTRRRFLRAVAGAATAPAVAGCSGVGLGPFAGDTGTYLDWIPAAHPAEDVAMFDRAAYRSVEDALHPGGRTVVERTFARDRSPLESFLSPPETEIRVGNARILAGVDVDAAGRSLRRIGYERTGTHRGATLYGLADDAESARVYDAYRRHLEVLWPPAVVGVGEGAVVGARNAPGLGAWIAVRRLLDAKRGREPRRHREREAFAAVADAQRGATVLRIGPRSGLPTAPGLLVQSVGWTLGRERSGARIALQFEDRFDAEVADASPFERRLEDYRGVETTREGATVAVEGTVDTRRFDGLLPGTPGVDGVPDVTFEFDVTMGGDEVTIRHAGGQSVPAEELVVGVTGNPTPQQFVSRYDRVGPGDELTVARVYDFVTVLWRHPERRGSVRLAVKYVGDE